MHKSPLGPVCAPAELCLIRWGYDNPSLMMEDLFRHWEGTLQRQGLNLEYCFAVSSNFFSNNIGVPSAQADLCCFIKRSGLPDPRQSVAP